MGRLGGDSGKQTEAEPLSRCDIVSMDNLQIRHHRFAMRRCSVPCAGTLFLTYIVWVLLDWLLGYCGFAE
ncbi:hypothetical protein BD310DRAFT_933297 [Dichomitus squalens]|uniref:Uncharacterized protein n=1 Tax=Dichomitus squalens TaxID=114155 RepID=A0A4Q9PN27_9APHY|nr:hypothetical protein BD310DRAFT_933297 [Dichomitus squalens]